MAWNEPGGGGRDPWGSRDGDKGPPDLDELMRRAQARLKGLFGGGGGGGGGRGAGGFGIGLLIIIALAVWGLSGIYIVDDPERGVVLRFGEYVKTAQPGPHWHWPYPIESVVKVNVARIRTAEVGFRSIGEGNRTRPVKDEALMLTQDENIVNLRLAIQYRVSDPKNYVFNVRSPDATLKAAAESTIREVVGKSKMDFVLTEGRGEITDRSADLLQSILEKYQAGLELTNFTLQRAQPPEQVQPAFEDAIEAREDEERSKAKAQAYANEILQKARGQASRRLEEARGYKQERIARAEGEADRFTAVREEYSLAPAVTRKRLYLETMQEVLSNTGKVLVDVKGGNNLLYLPLDKLMRQRGAAESAGSAAAASSSGKAQQNGGSGSDAGARSRESLRMRGSR